SRVAALSATTLQADRHSNSPESAPIILHDPHHSYRSRRQRRSRTRRRRKLHIGSYAGRREADRRNSTRRDARPANVLAAGRRLSPWLRGSGCKNQRSPALPLAWADDRLWPSLHSPRCPEEKSRWPRSREDERLPLASLGKSRLPRRE